jgi:uncharacterized protein
MVCCEVKIRSTEGEHTELPQASSHKPYGMAEVKAALAVVVASSCDRNSWCSGGFRGVYYGPEGMLVKIWVDADACPGEIKELIIRAGRRLKILVVFVANKYISIPDSPCIASVRIGMEPEAVDEYLSRNAISGNIAVTQDIPLASLLVRKGVVVITPHGVVLTEENIGERLSIRNFMQDIREAGGITPGPRQFSLRDKQRFSDSLDRELTKSMKGKTSSAVGLKP